ncbi:MAG: agmatine deiminase [Lachnospiraceae bacterium]|nr:agmatine deiminase [Lachnospiraceae bacterium]
MAVEILDIEKIKDSVRFPGEFEPHHGTLMVWPHRPGSWGKDKSGAVNAFIEIIFEILKREEMYLIVTPSFKEEAGKSIEKRIDEGGSLSADEKLRMKNRFHLIQFETDDSWARDIGPTFVKIESSVKDESAKTASKKRAAINWKFNAWGGEFDGLYASWDKDDALAKVFAERIGDPVIDAGNFVLEGGSIHTDGEGTLMVTESCLLSKGRNPEMPKQEIEDTLKKYLNVQKVLWLPCGIYNDETNEHVDNVAAFIRPSEIVLAWTDKTCDPQYEMSRRDLEYLEKETDAKGRRLKVHKLPIPDVPVTCTKEDIDNYIFEEGEDEREVGERLAASYVNFYFANGCILLPQFGGENKESDKRAVCILSELCPDKRIVPISARSVLLGGGNIHCITQQIPEV